MKKTTYKIGIIFSVALVLFILPIWNVQNLEVSGNNVYTQEEILKAVDFKPNSHILSLNTKGMYNRLIQLPYIEEASINYKFPNRIDIDLVERAPIAYVPFLDTYLCIDPEGYVLQQVKTKQLELPTVEGLTFSSFQMGERLPLKNTVQLEVLEEIIYVLNKYSLTKEVDVIELTNIEQIHLYVNRLNVIIGNMRDFDEKVKWLAEVHKEFPMGILDLSLIQYDQAILKPLN